MGWLRSLWKKVLGNVFRTLALRLGVMQVVVGHWVTVVVAGREGQGLPLGLQLIGRPFDEETLFSLGEVIEQAAGRFTPARWW